MQLGLLSKSALFVIHSVYFLHPDRERTETYRIKSDEEERKSENRWLGVGQRENGVKKKRKSRRG